MINLKRKAWEMNISLKGNALRFKSRLSEWQWLPALEMARLQKKRLVMLLKHSYAHVPYYKNILKSYGVVDDFGDVHLEKFNKIPLLDKDTINCHFEALKSDDLHSRDWYQNSSGGSTGVPVQLIQDRDFSDWSNAVKILDDEWTGLLPNGRRAYVWGSVRDTLAGKETLKTYMGRWLRNELWLNSFLMTQEKMLEFVHKLNRFKPIQITAFAENIYDLARFIEQKKLIVHPPKSILSSAGVLYPHMRETIERVFHSAVYNRYGSREVGDVACECERHNGLHIMMFTHYVEILRPDGTPTLPGESGEIVITLLTNYSMPLIRYKIGDMGVLTDEECSCGRELPLLKELVGRTSDTFLNCNGDLVDGRMFIRLLILQPFIQKFQVIQEQVEKLRILIVPVEHGNGIDFRQKNTLQKLTEDIRIFMGSECDVKFEFVDHIEATQSGKYRFLISKVPK